MYIIKSSCKIKEDSSLKLSDQVMILMKAMKGLKNLTLEK